MIRTIKHILETQVIFRFILSGGTSAVVDLAALYVLYSLFHIYYLAAAVAAFLVAFCVSFTLHKYWTFKTDVRHNVSRQAALYMVTSLIGLCFNTLLMYIFVDWLHVFVMLAQIFAALIVACCTFFMSRNIVFKWKKPLEPLV